MTLKRFGIEVRSELTTIFIPSFLDTILSGLSALKALNPLKKLTLILLNESRIQLSIENETIVKSNAFQGSLKYVPLPNTNPSTIILATASAIKIPDIIVAHRSNVFT